MTNQEIILDCLKSRIRNSKPMDQFTITTMEMHAFNMLLKEDIYSIYEDSSDSEKQKIDTLWDKIITLNFNAWCNSINNNMNITISDYLKSFNNILDELLDMRIYVNNSIFELNKIILVKESIKKYII